MLADESSAAALADIGEVLKRQRNATIPG
jgi:hypothetical protein